MTTSPASGRPFELEYPQKVADFTRYEDAQAAVDFLADEKFPVENLMIVGTGLRSVERVIGRKTWGSVIAGGAISGLGMGLFVGLMLFLFSGGLASPWVMLLVGLLMGAIIGVLSAVLAYSLSGGKRDFDSLRQTVASTYELMCEHKHAEEARQLLARRPGASQLP